MYIYKKYGMNSITIDKFYPVIGIILVNELVHQRQYRVLPAGQIKD